MAIRSKGKSVTDFATKIGSFAHDPSDQSARLMASHRLVTVDNDTVIPSQTRLISPQVRHTILTAARRMWQVSEEKQFFPQNNPVSLEKRHLSVLRDKDYACTYKSDGINYYLILTRALVPGTQSLEPIAVMVNRAECVYEVQVCCEDRFFDGTMLVGELLLVRGSSHGSGDGLGRKRGGADGDYDDDKGALHYEAAEPVFQVYDVVALAGDTDVHRNDFNTRYALLHDIWLTTTTRIPMPWATSTANVAPNEFMSTDDMPTPPPPPQPPQQQQQERAARLQHIPNLKLASEWAARGRLVLLTLPSAVKDYYPKRLAATIETERTARLPFDTDGLIFVPVQSPLRVGRQLDLFKMKQHHTIDLQLDLWTDRYTLSFHHDGVLCEMMRPTTDSAVTAPASAPSPTQQPQQQQQQQHLSFRGAMVLGKLENDGKGNEIFRQLRLKHDEWGHKKRLRFIVECACELLPGNILSCFIVRLRGDKTMPNDKRTIEGTLLNVTEGLTHADLVL